MNITYIFSTNVIMLSFTFSRLFNSGVVRGHHSELVHKEFVSKFCLLLRSFDGIDSARKVDTIFFSGFTTEIRGRALFFSSDKSGGVK